MQTAAADRGAILVERFALVGLVLTGTVVRLAYGVGVRPWQAQPDQDAWALLLSEARRVGLRADQLVHAPHDLGSALSALLALLLQPLASGSLPALSLPALSLAALVVDTLVRLVQVLATRRLFGPRTALCLGLWEVVALPVLLPWGTVNVALHHASSAWPFVVLAVLHGGSDGVVSLRRSLAVGVVAGLALAWSSSNLALVALVPVLLVLATLRRRASPAVLVGVVPLALDAAILTIVRETLDLGLHIEGLGPWSVRSLPLTDINVQHIAGRFAELWAQTLPTGLFSSPFGPGPLGPGIAFVVMGIAGVLLTALRRPTRAISADAVVIIVGFSLAWLLSPLSELPTGHRDYFAWRHLTWMLPLFVAVALHGWALRPWAGWLAAGAASTASLALLLQGPVQPVPQADDAAVGWILGRKLGHDPARLAAIVDAASAPRRAALRQGCGWGVVAATVGFSPTSARPSLDGLIALRDGWPLLDRPDVDAGMRRGLEQLAPAALPDLAARSWQRGLRLDGPLVQAEPDRVALYGNGRVDLDVPAAGPVSLVVSGSTAGGRGPTARVERHGRLLVEQVVGPERLVLSVPPVPAGTTLSLVYADDLVDDRGHDRDLFLWWVEVGGGSAATVTGE